MTYSVEHSCTQCGGPIEFAETERLIECSFCGVKSFLLADQCHFILPARMDGQHLFAPYLRFRGVEYYTDSRQVGFRIVDFSQLGLPMRALPSSLGVRPQALKLRFAGGKQQRLLKNFLSLPDALSKAEKAVRAIRQRDIIHRAYIGETISRVYLPLSIQDGRLFDAVSSQEIGKLPDDRDIFAPAYDLQPSWQPKFVATICPQCGWNLEGAGDSIVLSCKACDTLWGIQDGRLQAKEFQVMASGNGDSLYLPFWKMETQFSGIELDSYAQFLRLTNQPLVVQRGWESRKLFFWAPAFKVKPKIYLRLSKQLTVCQKEFEAGHTMPKNLHPITLPAKEAVESIKIVLASCACNKKNVLPLLANISSNVTSSSIVYLPFSVGFHDLVAEQFKITITKKVLEYGRYL